MPNVANPAILSLMQQLNNKRAEVPQTPGVDIGLPGIMQQIAKKRADLGLPTAPLP